MQRFGYYFERIKAEGSLIFQEIRDKSKHGCNPCTGNFERLYGTFSLWICKTYDSLEKAEEALKEKIIFLRNSYWKKFFNILKINSIFTTNKPLIPHLLRIKIFRLRTMQNTMLAMV